MAIKEIQAKTLLSAVTTPDAWFGMKYTMNLYRGCEHQCIYCDSRSACYQIEDFRDLLVKANALDLLRDELARKRQIGIIGTGAMSDPYTPSEARLNLTGQALKVIASFGFPVHILTKSDLVLKDLPTLLLLNRTFAAVTFTLTTLDDALAAQLEPGAPSPSRRLAAMRALARAGIRTGTALMPVLPFIEDSPASVAAIIRATRAAGGRYVVPWFSVTLRDRQRAYFYDKLDRLFPGLRLRYERAYGERYDCASPRAGELYPLANSLCDELDLERRMAPWKATPDVEQPSLF